MRIPGRKIDVAKMDAGKLQRELRTARAELERAKAVDALKLKPAELEQHRAETLQIAARVGAAATEAARRNEISEREFERIQIEEVRQSGSAHERLNRIEQARADHDERYARFKTETAEAKRIADARTREQLAKVGKVRQLPTWEGVNPRPLAVLCSALVWRYARNLFVPGMIYVDEHGNELTEPLPGGRAPTGRPMIDGDGILALWFALMVCAERGEAPDWRVSFHPREPLLWPAEWPRNVATFGRLRALGLIQFEHSADRWTFALGPDAVAMMPAFDAAFAPQKPRGRLSRLVAPDVTASRAAEQTLAAVRERAAKEAAGRVRGG